MIYWTEIHPDFTEKLQKEWEEKGFTYEQTKEWIDVGMNPAYINYCVWLRDIKRLTATEVLNYEDVKKLRKDHNNYLEKEIKLKQAKSELQSLQLQHVDLPKSKVKWLTTWFKRNKLEKKIEDYSKKVEELTSERDEFITAKESELENQLPITTDGNQPSSSSEIFINNETEPNKKGKGKSVVMKSSNDIQIQKWLDQNYPKAKRSKITKLDISGENLEGNLDLSDFVKLELLDCSDNKLTALNLSKCSRLKGIKCFTNQLTNLNISNCSQLEGIDCRSNLITNLTLHQNLTNLNFLSLNDNNFPSQNLSFLTAATNLEYLFLGNWDEEKINQNIYNRFTGSLNYLSGMKKLKSLDVSNTDLSEVDITKLPNILPSSLVSIYFYTDHRSTCKLTAIVPHLKRYTYGLCQKCQQFNTSKDWCQPCETKEWQGDLKNLTGQELIEKFIQKQQLREIAEIKWIPYEQFSEIEYLAEGGFSRIYKAKWGKDRYGDDRIVVLKILTNSQNITTDFLTEIANTKLVDGSDFYFFGGLEEGRNIVSCYGISQDPATKNYVMVMEYMAGGNLRQYLKNKYSELNWKHKLAKLMDIVQGLKKIHDQGLVHRDFHVGNILLNNKEKDEFLAFFSAATTLSSSSYIKELFNKCYITDLGLCRPVNCQPEKGKIFGVLPYVAPEVLQGQTYTKKSDIYSFGMIMYEMLTGLPPFYDQAHDPILGARICTGLRPQFQIAVPALLENLVKQCWDTEPSQRPFSIYWLNVTLSNWHSEISDKEDTEFTRQVQVAEEFNETEEKKRVCRLLSQLYYQYRGQVKEINFKEDEGKEELIKELYSEFCQRHNYEEESEEVQKEFEKLLFPRLNLNVHEEAFYCSKPINTQQITELLKTQRQYWGSQNITLDLDKLSIQEPQAESSTQAQIQIPPK